MNGTSYKPIKSGDPNLSRNLIDELDSSALTIGSKIFSRDIVMMLVHHSRDIVMMLVHHSRDIVMMLVHHSRDIVMMLVHGEISWHSSDVWISYIAS